MLLTKSFILLLSLLLPHLINAAPNPYNSELGKATLKDVKKQFRILESSSFGKGTYHSLDNSYFGGVWCDADDIVQGMEFIEIIYSFEDIIESLSKNAEYKLLGNVSTDLDYLKQNARFKAGDYDILVVVDRDERFKTISYMNKDFKEALIATKSIPYFE